MKYNVVSIRKPISLQALDVTETCFIVHGSAKDIPSAQFFLETFADESKEQPSNFIILQSFEK